MEEALAAPPTPVAPPFDAEELFRESAADVFAYVATLLGDRALAEDVVAQAFERAWRKRRGFRPGRGTPRAWLFGIARNAALDELRRRTRVAAPPDEWAPEELDDPAEDLARRATVRAALQRLDPRDRELVALRFHAGLAHHEIARVLGISPSNAATRLHRALTRLRELCDA